MHWLKTENARNKSNPINAWIGIDMNPIAVTVIVGAAFTILVPMSMRLPSQRKRYQGMADQKLIAIRVYARMMRSVMLAVTFFVPIPFAFIVATLTDSVAVTVLSWLMILVTFCGIMGFWLFFEIVRLSTTEIEFRQSHEEKEHATEQRPGNDSE